PFTRRKPWCAGLPSRLDPRMRAPSRVGRLSSVRSSLTKSRRTLYPSLMSSLPRVGPPAPSPAVGGSLPQQASRTEDTPREAVRSVEPTTGLEPVTARLQVGCATNCATSAERPVYRRRPRDFG